MITLTEKEYVELLIRSRDYAVIDSVAHSRLAACDLVHIEAVEGQPTFLLYWLTDWKRSQERLDKRKAANEAIRVRKLRHREAIDKVVSTLIKQMGTPLEITKPMVERMAENKSNENIIRAFNVLLEDEYDAFFDTSSERECVWANM